MNFFGIGMGAFMLLAIGLGFAWVIQLERRFGYLWWPYALALGILLVAVSLFIKSGWGSGLVGILGASIVWGATELKVQSRRAKQGWFPFQAHKIHPPFAERIEKWKAPRL